MAHDLEAEQRLRALLTDPAWELPAWPDPAGRVRAAARQQRQRSARLAATAAALCTVVVSTVVVSTAVVSTGLTGRRPGDSAPAAAGQAYSLPAANAAGFPAGVYPRTEFGPLLRRGSRCPDPAGVLNPPASVHAETAAVVRHLGAGFESDLRSSDPSDWPSVLTSWRSGVAATAQAAPVLYSGPLSSRPAAAWSAVLARAVRISCGARITAATWLVVTDQRGPSAPRSEYLLLDRRGHLLVWHTE